MGVLARPYLAFPRWPLLTKGSTKEELEGLQEKEEDRVTGKYKAKIEKATKDVAKVRAAKHAATLPLRLATAAPPGRRVDAAVRAASRHVHTRRALRYAPAAARAAGAASRSGGPRAHGGGGGPDEGRRPARDKLFDVRGGYGRRLRLVGRAVHRRPQQS